jgi:hypothetical protein
LKITAHHRKTFSFGYYRSSQSPEAEWWPGGISSPHVYYHLRSKQLLYAQKYPHQAGIRWRGPREVHTQQSSLLNRRRQAPLAVLAPAFYTNVDQNDSSVHYLGDKVVQLTRKPIIATPAVPLRPAVVTSSAAAVKRGIEAPMRPPRATWSHTSEYLEHMLVSRRSSGSSITNCGLALDPKRRCTVPASGESAAASFLPAGHFIARTSSSSAVPSPPRVYPGIVLQQQQPHHQVHGGSSGSTPATLLGAFTPPLPPMDPLSAGSNSSSVSIASLHSIASGDIAIVPTTTMPTHAAAVWELTSASAQPAMVESTTLVPVLSILHNNAGSMNHHGNTNQYHQDQDPTMQQYYTRQYNIKQEQAFPCHQVVEIGPSTISAIGGGYTNYGMNTNQVEDQRTDDATEDATAAGSDVGGWAVSLLKSLAGSIKRSVSP